MSKIQECVNCGEYYEHNNTMFCSAECESHWVREIETDIKIADELGLNQHREENEPTRNAEQTDALRNVLRGHGVNI